MERDLARLENIIEETRRTDAEVKGHMTPEQHHDARKLELSTVVVQLLNGATVRGDALNEIDWDLFIKICDLINDRPEVYCKAFVKGMRYHFKNYSKNTRVEWLTLNLLETCVKNCGRPFFNEINSKDFVEVIKKIADRIRKSKGGRKANNLSARDMYSDRIEEKILRMVQSFGPLNPVNTNNIYTATYDKMRKKGILFPTASFEDQNVFTQPRTRQTAMAKKSIPNSSTEIPQDIRQKLEEIKEVVGLVEEIHKASPKEELNKNEIAMELKPNLIKNRDSLTELIQKYSNDQNESFLNILLLLFEKCENVLAIYDGKQNLPLIDDNFSSNYSSDEEFAPKPLSRNGSSNPFATDASPPGPGYNPFMAQPPVVQKQNSTTNANPQQQEDFFRSPVELGLDLLASMKSNKPAQTQPQKDPLLDWLLRG